MSGHTSHRKDVRLAAAAYHAALEGKWDAAERYVKRLSDECGGEGITVALMAWCDAFADHATGGKPVVRRVKVAMVNGDTGRMDQIGSPDVPPQHQWASRLVQARAVMDEEAWSAVIDDLPEAPSEYSQYIWAVLQGVAHTVNGLPRGYSRMGRGEDS